MQTTIETEKIPLKLWLDDIEEGALEQARNLANLPFAFHHIAIMPDAHLGFGMPIGAVLATRDVIVPNAVGVDIGCGMCAVKTSLKEIDKSVLKKLLHHIRQRVPLGFKHHRKAQPHETMVRDRADDVDSLPVVRSEYDNARTQVGTLGGGNHFIEIQQGADRSIWFMIHSGSRNLGYRVASHYNKLAAELNKRRKNPIPTSWQLAWLDMNDALGQNYYTEMRYCVDFAEANRNLMQKRVKEALLEQVSADIEFEEPIQIAHNYAARETHFGTAVVVHRKGATRAQRGDTGIIPGSHGSLSYIVRGKSNPDSFHSCSHGAGRKMGRKQAQRQLDLEKEKRKLEGMQVVHSLRNRNDLDEAPGAYKDIDRVMEQQQDLIDIIDVLRPLAVIKG
jgi:tRNA-splicing ligase RtcB (3'-phosphate/5'-hydroxy nucleic acid ligase)